MSSNHIRQPHHNSSQNNPFKMDTKARQLIQSPLVPESESQLLANDLFKRFDVNLNNKLEPGELVKLNKFLQGKFKETQSEDLQPKSIFKTIEMDDEGNVNGHNFLRWVKVHMTYPNHLIDPEDQLKWQAEQNGTEYIPPDESDKHLTESENPFDVLDSQNNFFSIGDVAGANNDANPFNKIRVAKRNMVLLRMLTEGISRVLEEGLLIIRGRR